MYIRKCLYCGKIFESTHPNTKHCSKYHAGKAREVKYKIKKYKIIKSWTKDPNDLVDIKYIAREYMYDEIKEILSRF